MKSYAAIVILAAAVLCVAQTKSKSVWDGVYTADQAKRGEERYGRQCGHCHGDDLEGDIVENPQLAGPMFRDKWNGLNLGQLYERIHRDMPLNRAGTLSRDASIDLVAFILSANNYPAGSTALPAEPQALESIVIHSTRDVPK